MHSFGRSCALPAHRGPSKDAVVRVVGDIAHSCTGEAVVFSQSSSFLFDPPLGTPRPKDSDVGAARPSQRSSLFGYRLAHTWSCPRFLFLFASAVYAAWPARSLEEPRLENQFVSPLPGSLGLLGGRQAADQSNRLPCHPTRRASSGPAAVMNRLAGQHTGRGLVPLYLPTTSCRSRSGAGRP